MKFTFKVFTRSVPGICIVGGIALVISSKVANLGAALFGLGVFLIVAGIGLYVLYLYLNSKRDR